jgi:hypothetical protein
LPFIPLFLSSTFPSSQFRTTAAYTLSVLRTSAAT